MRAVIEKGLPLRLNRGRYTGLCCCGNPLDGAVCRCPQQFIAIETFDQLSAYYDAAPESQQERLFAWILEQCERHGPAVMECLHLSWTASNIFLAEGDDPGTWRCERCGFLADNPYEHMGMRLAPYG